MSLLSYSLLTTDNEGIIYNLSWILFVSLVLELKVLSVLWGELIIDDIGLFLISVEYHQFRTVILVMYNATHLNWRTSHVQCHAFELSYESCTVHRVWTVILVVYSAPRLNCHTSHVQCHMSELSYESCTVHRIWTVIRVMYIATHLN